MEKNPSIRWGNWIDGSENGTWVFSGSEWGLKLNSGKLRIFGQGEEGACRVLLGFEWERKGREIAGDDVGKGRHFSIES